MIKIKRQILLLCVFFLSKTLVGQVLTQGPISAGQGGIYTTSSDLWSALNNQSFLPTFTKTTIGICYENRFLLKQLSTKALGAIIPISSGVFGISLSHFGFSLFGQTKLGLAYGMKLGKNINAGIKIDYFYLFINDEFSQRKHLFTFEGGFNYAISEKWLLGFHCFNPIMAKLGQDNDERLTTLISIGTRFLASKNVSFATEIEKDIYHKPRAKFGVDYNFSQHLNFRSGIATKPTTFALGIGTKIKNFSFDFASSYHQILGFSPSISLIYSF